MKNITNTDSIRSINGGSSIADAMGLIGGVYEVCKMAWDFGDWLGTKIGKAIFG